MLRNRRALVFILFGLAVMGVLSGLAIGSSSSADTIPAYDVTLTPNWVSPNDSTSLNYQNVWLYATSPTTPYRSPDSYKQIGRYLLLDPRATDADGRRGNDDWWFVIQRYWPSSYPSGNHGNWGTEVNFHNVAGDAGPGGGVGWDFGTGVSALFLGWPSGAPSPIFNVEPNAPQTEFALPSVSRDAWHTYVVHWVAGRTDGSTVHPGSLTVWADGSESPAINATNINTVQRAKGPDGNYYTQRWVQLWEGDYTQGLPQVSTVRLALTRIGTSLGEALADRPTLVSDNTSNQFYRGSGMNAGAPSVSNVGGLPAAAAAIPSSLGGAGPVASSSPPPATTTATTATTTTTSGTTTTTASRVTTTAKSTTTTTAAPTTTTTAAAPGQASTGTGKGKKVRRPARSAFDRVETGVTVDPPLAWDGASFSTWRGLRSHLSGRGVDANRFLVRHVGVAAKFQLAPMTWDGQTFYLRSAFAAWLRSHGLDGERWARQHPAAMSRLSA